MTKEENSDNAHEDHSQIIFHSSAIAGGSRISRGALTSPSFCAMLDVLVNLVKKRNQLSLQRHLTNEFLAHKLPQILRRIGFSFKERKSCAFMAILRCPTRPRGMTTRGLGHQKKKAIIVGPSFEKKLKKTSNE